LIEAPLALQALAAGQLQTAKMPFITAEKARALSEQRSVPRRRVSMGSWIISLDGALVQACQTRDVSAFACISRRPCVFRERCSISI
jgi:hypothetical protein